MTGAGNVTDDGIPAPFVENNTEGEMIEELTNETAEGALNITDVAPAPASGIVTLTETGLANRTGDGDGLYGLTLSVSGRYSFNPTTGIEMNQTIGQLVIEGSSSATESANENQTADLVGNATQNNDVQIVTTRFNLTNTIVTISEDFRNVTIASDINEITDGSNGAAGNILSLMTFEFPIDFTSNDQIFNTTAGSQNTIQAIISSFNYETNPATTEGQLVVDVDTAAALEQELNTLNQSDQLEEEIVRENSTLPERIQDTVFQTLNLTVPTTSEVEENITDSGGNMPDANATSSIVEMRIKPLLQNVSGEQIANLTENQQTLFEFLRDSLIDDDLTDSQKIQAALLLDQLGNQSNGSAEPEIVDIVVGLGVILLGGQNPDAEASVTESNLQESADGVYYVATSLYSSNNSSARGENLHNVLLEYLPIIGAIIGAIRDWLRDKSPPSISPPPDIVMAATGTCTYVDLYQNGYPYAWDDRDDSPTITNNALPCFPLGITYVVWTVTDDAGNFATATQAVVIEEGFRNSFSIYQTGIAQVGEDINEGTTECGALPVVDVRASGDDGNVPPNTLDNDLGTRWSGFGKGSWIMLDLGDEQVICDIEIAWYKGNIRSNDFTISTSEDGQYFEPIYSDISRGNTLSPERYDTWDTIGRYVKVTVYGNTINDWASITEIDIDGYELSSTVTQVAVQVSGSYEFSEADGLTVDPSDLESSIIIYDSESGEVIEQKDLAPVSVTESQLAKRITVEAEVDSPVEYGYALGALRFDYPVDFRYGGQFQSTSSENELVAYLDDTYDTQQTSIGQVDIDVPIECALYGCPIVN